ncbi:sugar ABC transporter substrate-binding protein [Luteitalea sp. TBR-22]|uniref:polysaccharide biosynthesis/export family protein n=1 Tax=Luteitalea sp. TBR-22 TaxID=2802971 RepID=UPI001AF09B77|nr:polysaccharide biosynthesis/export family protein [Luteitalea sp. TBR-22]BCS33219.1 sugar ABC transporter substrate-binding protein [Luteitalea sp. TBR-22]
MRILSPTRTVVLATAVLCPTLALAQAPAGVQAPASATPVVDANYVIGPDDVLGVVFWELPTHGGDVVVRPDGKITLPLINDIQAAGLTPDQLRTSIRTASAKFIKDPDVTIIVKQINSKKVFVTGQVGKPGPYPITQPTTVLQMLAIAGGPTDFAKKTRISVMRTVNGQTTSFKFNYKDVIQGKKLEQNILLMPGDTVVIP